jgi:hypothetical protein
MITIKDSTKVYMFLCYLIQMKGTHSLAPWDADHKEAKDKEV